MFFDIHWHATDDVRFIQRHFNLHNMIDSYSNLYELKFIHIMIEISLFRMNKIEYIYEYNIYK